MRVNSVLLLIVFICLSLSSNASEKGNNAGHILVLNLVGDAAPYEMDVDGFEEPATCFDVNLINAKNGKMIGTATDCLSDIVPGSNGGLELIGTTFFYLHEGMIVTRGSTTVQEANHEIMTASGISITHITGAAGAENAIIDGTGRFADSTGTVRLSGMVSMHDGGIYFDCLFVITLTDE
ncbi:hypothetical protein RI845_17375 [Thalassotalea nanhaiensis]|uniref:DUF4402 domain-containing protein n=1 Tax=Thalassotalea nanhaiensis TaxID=3065648 RepID=A0ABY9THV1_9GAMM|nr:hypothetical protein RI845_17375 [Colwelliaceae bacterium SQ345]